MDTMAPTRPTVLRSRHIPLTAAPAAAAEARRQVHTTIRAWDVPVDAADAALLASELVTNAIRHQRAGPITVAVSCAHGALRVDVHDRSSSEPVLVEATPDAETGRGLMLVASLSTDWGCYRTPSGKAVYFTLAFSPRADGGGHRRRCDRGPGG